MRELTDAEARVLGILLGSRGEPERERLRDSGLARSTYHSIRQRAYRERWVVDRYIPHPGLLGAPWVQFALGNPFAERLPEVVARWGGEGGLSVLWQGGATVFAVLFHPSPGAAESAVRRMGSPDLMASARFLSLPATADSVPIYFDFEGLWGHLAHLPGSNHYPRSILPPGEERRPRELSPSQIRSAAEILARPFRAESEGRPAHRVGPLGLPRSQRRLMAQGAVGLRTILGPGPLPPYQGRRADLLVFVRGEVKSEGSASALLPTLLDQCRVYPFLWAVGPTEVWMGALGHSQGAPGPPEPARRPVLATLGEELQGIEVTREPLSGLRRLVDHRYDRLVPRLP